MNHQPQRPPTKQPQTTNKPRPTAYSIPSPQPIVYLTLPAAANTHPSLRPPNPHKEIPVSPNL
ncbi:hypothetical protein BO71DRAFT_402567 [Aspergillus ellipticus CBS 707.79]|uniref:Uncharacterized protein n=1 Tax=Aspergillus ellipticus CBS 707.79 TaxID=1448320 RepID=A0A319CZ33_9EURO|nr:hypothetical protein BO71DRAFT_402567 [Aspergillus ellipticus CBS 707.79]